MKQQIAAQNQSSRDQLRRAVAGDWGQYEATLRQQLAASRGGKKNGRKKIRWVIAKGGLPAGVDIANRAAMHEWLRKHP